MKRQLTTLMLAIVSTLGFFIAFQPAAYAEGPGYGGTADTLNVAWNNTGTDIAPTTTPPQPTTVKTNSFITASFVSSINTPTPYPTDPSVSTTRTDNQLSLAITGVGFKGNSLVKVNIGNTSVSTRVDEIGILNVNFPVPLTNNQPAITTGQSVIAKGQTPNGGQKTLLGSVPPPASGTNPLPLIVSIITLLLLPFAAKKLNNKRRHSDEEKDYIKQSI